MVAEGQPHEQHITVSLAWFAISLVALVRVLVGFQPHSGQDNWHGSKVAYGGDAEAQRHWMELTYHLPLGEWYYHDLHYWGLDYPPLTAYVSQLCGALAHHLVGPSSVALYESRNREMDGPTKSFLRATVLVLDLMLYGTAVWWIVKEAVSESNVALSSTGSRRFSHQRTVLVTFITVMLQPAIILIDHGHFQYNTVALGLALWSFYFMTQPEFAKCVLGSVLFVAALSFKQMTLYFAPAVFSYLLARCLRPVTAATTTRHNSLSSWRSSTFRNRFLALGATVILSFVALWWPFVVYGPQDASYLSRLQHVLHRILPMERGLFESKVSNLWCVLSLKPISIRERISPAMQPMAALALTTALMLPSCIALYRGARNAPFVSDSSPRSSRRTWVSKQRQLLLRGTACCACAFFLASFQVHEKSLLIALAPASLLMLPTSSLAEWFGIVTTWTLWPLLVLDRLQVAYVATLVFFIVATQIRRHAIGESPSSLPVQILRGLTYAAMLGLHVAELALEPPPRTPDLFPALWSVVGCALVSCTWLVLCWQLLSSDRAESVKVKTS
jgi:alpha-1,3-glucosyltransferase